VRAPLPARIRLPAQAPAGIVLVVHDFLTVFDDDFLFVRDAASGAPLALLTGELPTPFALRLDAAALRVSFLARPGNRNLGFNVSWSADAGAPCPSSCSSLGTCSQGLCACTPGHAGADCSIALQPLLSQSGAFNGTAVAETLSGSLQPGEVQYFEVLVPASVAGLPGGASLLLEMTWNLPAGADGSASPAPLLMMQNASAMRSHASYNSSADGSCGSTGCAWVTHDMDAAGGVDSDVPAAVHFQAGPTTDYRLGGAPLTKTPPAFPLRDMRLPSLPSPTSATLRDTAAWAARDALHRILVPAEQLTPGKWVVGVANTRPLILPSFLARDTRGAWGQGAGYLGGAGAMEFSVRAVIASSADDLCPRGCSARGACVAGRCVCESAMGDSSTAAPRAAFAGSGCETAAQALQPGTALNASLSPGQLALFWVPLDPGSVFNAQMMVELSFGDSPGAAPWLLLSRASQGPVARLPSPCALFAPAPRGPWAEDDCGAGEGGARFDAGWKGVREDTGEPYLSIRLPPETHILPTSLIAAAGQALAGRRRLAQTQAAAPAPAPADAIEAATRTSIYEHGYYVAVFAPALVDAAPTMSYSVRASFQPAAAAATPSCPFDCLGRAQRCDAPPAYAAFAAAGTAVALAGSCTCQGTTVASNGTVSAEVAPSGPVFAGLFCQNDALPLSPSGAVSGSVPYGGWSHYYMDVPGAGVATLRLDAQDDGRAATPPPVLLLRNGQAPRAARTVFSGTLEFLNISLISGDTASAPPPGDPSTHIPLNGSSFGALASPRNSFLSLRGLLPPGARVVQVSYRNLRLLAIDASAARGACWALATGAEGYVAAACPAVRGGAVGTSGGDGGGGGGVELAPDAGGADGGPSQPTLAYAWARTLSGSVALDGALQGGTEAVLELFQLGFTGGPARAGGTPAAVWDGVVTLGYARPLDRGLDASDLTASLCAGRDCPAGGPRLAGFLADSTPARVFVSVYRPRLDDSDAAARREAASAAVRADPSTGAAVAMPQLLPLPFTLSSAFAAGAGAQAPCMGGAGCGEHGNCSRGAPLCTCEAGWFGPDCSVYPQVLSVPDQAAFGGGGGGSGGPGAPSPAPARSLSSSVTGVVLPGRFAYYKLSDAGSVGLSRSLLISLRSPAAAAARGRMYLRAGALPVACKGTAGAAEWALLAAGCRDLFDATDAASHDSAAAAGSDAVVRTLTVTPRGGGATRASLLARAARGPLYLAVSNPPSSLEALDFTLDVAAAKGILCPGAGNCSGHGTCDVQKGLCACAPDWSGAACDAPQYVIVPSADAAAASKTFPAVIKPGGAAFLTFSINCTDQALNLTLIPAPSDGAVSEGSSSSTSSSSSSSSSSDESGGALGAVAGFGAGEPGGSYVLALRRGGRPALLARLFDAVAAPRQSDGVTTIALPALRPGVYTAEVSVSKGASSPMPGFTVKAVTSPSRVPNVANGCQFSDNTLRLTLIPSDPATDAPSLSLAVTKTGPPTGSLARADGPGDPPAEVYEVAAESCGDVLTGTSCYLGSAQSSGRVVPPEGTRGVGPVSGSVVLALSQPAQPNDAAYFYLVGDPRKHLGAYSPAAAQALSGGGAASTATGPDGMLGPADVPGANVTADAPASQPAGPPPPALMYAAPAGAADSVDFEGCGPLLNAAGVAASGVCLVVRGGCPFAAKARNCQAAGAKLVFVANNNAGEAAASNSWLLSGEDATQLRIPTLALSYADGAQLLGWMLDPRVTFIKGNPPPYTRTVAVTAEAYSCTPSTMCAMCAPGLASPADGCSSAACPGMDALFSRNCTGNGECTLAAASATCACATGWGGDACERSTQPPWFTTSPPATLAARPGDMIRFVSRAADPTGGAIRYSLQVGPPGASMNPRSGLFSFDTSKLGLPVGESRSIPVVIAATAPNGLSAQQMVTVLVSDSPAAASNASDAAATAYDGGAPAPAPAIAPGVPPSEPGLAPAPSGGDSSQQKSGTGALAAPPAPVASWMLPPAPGGHHKKAKGGLDGGAVAGIVVSLLATLGLALLAVKTWRTKTVRNRSERHTQLVEF